MFLDVHVGPMSNRGDALMLYAIQNELGRKFDLVVMPSVADYRVRATMGLFQKLWVDKVDRVLGGTAGNTVPGEYRKKYGLILEQECAAGLDASGYAYGDPWGTHKAKRMLERLRRLKRAGKPFIFLPQSFGPFQKAELRAIMSEAIESADLVFARDATSYGHITQLCGERDHVFTSPDFTYHVPGIATQDSQELITENLVCIIPSHRMVDSVEPEVATRYPGLLCNAFRTLKNSGMSPIFVVHETADYALAQELARSIGPGCKVFTDPDPRILKGLIGKSRMVVSSRFHGLVSALTQNVPVIAIGWTHKFQRLLDEYQCAEYVFNPADGEEALQSKLETLMDASIHARVEGKIRTAGFSQVKLIGEMWSRVFSCLPKPGGT